MTPIKTAVIGYGLSAKTFHLPFIRALAEFELSAISTSQTEQVSQDWPEIDHYLSASELIENSDAELVIITAPNDVHFDLAKLALENHKHVILEKPFVTEVAEGEALIALAKQQQLQLSVYQNRRWDGDFITLQKMINDGRFGEIKHFESHFDRFRPEVRQRWREQASVGGGILFDLGPHLIDQTLQLFGLPEAVTAQCETMREGSNNVDYFNLILHYPKHLACLHADLYSAGPNRRYIVKGSAGSYEKSYLDPQEPQLAAGLDPTHPDWGAEPAEHYGYLYQNEQAQAIPSERGCYQQYFQQMAQAIRHNAPLPVSAEEALWSIKLIKLAMESSRLGRTLKLPQD